MTYCRGAAEEPPVQTVAVDKQAPRTFVQWSAFIERRVLMATMVSTLILGILKDIHLLHSYQTSYLQTKVVQRRPLSTSSSETLATMQLICKIDHRC